MKTNFKDQETENKENKYFHSVIDDIEYSRQVDYIGQDIFLKEARIPQIAKSITLIALLFLIVFISWSSITTVSQIVTSNGEIRSTTPIYTIQHPKGGLVEEVNVNEGQLVSEGDILYRLGDENLFREKRILLTDLSSLDLQKKRLDVTIESSITVRKLREINTVLVKKQERLAVINEKIDKLNIRAPTAGIARNIAIHNIGDVISPNQKILEVIPVDDKANATIKISPKDIGFVQVNMPVNIKVNSYHYRSYGFITGKIISITPYTYYSENSENYYRAVVALDKNYVGDNDMQNLILPGMKVKADIYTSRKSILAYILKPLNFPYEHALTEI